MKKTGAEIIWECLEREGVSVVFGYPGGAIMPTYDALQRLLDSPRPGAPRAGRRAHGRRLRARLSGKVGVAIATSGPGATNMVTGIATAMMDSVPIVCITGQVGSKLIGSRRLPGNRHHRRHACRSRSTTTWSRGPRTSRRPFARRSTSRSSGRPGPVLVDITKDAQQATLRVRLGRGAAAAAAAIAPSIAPDATIAAAPPR